VSLCDAARMQSERVDGHASRHNAVQFSSTRRRVISSRNDRQWICTFTCIPLHFHAINSHSFPFRSLSLFSNSHEIPTWLFPFSSHSQRERKCAECRYNWHSAGSLGRPLPMLTCKYIFQLKYTEAILSNSTRKLLCFEITNVRIAVSQK